MSKVPKDEGELRGTILRIPIADWIEEYAQEEPDLSSAEKALKLQVAKGIPPATMGILCLVGGLRGEASEDVALFPKTTLAVGAGATISRRLAQHKVDLEAPSGRKFRVRGIVANVHAETDDNGEDPGDDEMALEVEAVPVRIYTYAETGTQQALDLAENYLLQRVPGYIFGRLKIIAASHGDVEAAADLLKEKIDDMVDRLVEPVPAEA